MRLSKISLTTWRREAFALMFTATLLFNLVANSAFAQSRPPTHKLLPETTVAFIEITDIRSLVEKIKTSSMGQLIQDEEVAPLVQELWQTGLDAYDEFAEIGLSIEEIQSLPSGKISIAVVAPKRKKPDVIFMIETDPENEAVAKALQIGRDFAESEGAELESTEGEDVTFESIVNGGEQFTYFQKDGVIVGSNSQEQLDNLLIRWGGGEVEKIRPLSENRKYITIMNRCRGTKELEPDVKFYMDPIEFARSAFRGEVSAQFAINFLPLLGLDGVLALGGASIMEEDEFESVFHGHMLLANPRKGVLEMLAFKSSDYRPEAWVPEEATNYYSTSLDFPKLMVELEKLVDLVSGEGSFRTGLEENINEELGIDLEEEVIKSLGGRMSLITWMEPPARFTSQAFAIGIELEDREKFEGVVNLLRDRAIEDNPRVEEFIEETEYNGQSYWRITNDAMEQGENRRREFRLQRQRRRAERNGEEFNPDENVQVEFDTNQPQMCWGFIDNFAIICGSPQLYELMIDTYRGDRVALSEEPLFKKTSKKMTRLLRSELPCAIMYSQPREVMRAMVEAARIENTGQYFDLAPENEYVQRIRSAMENNPLPDFERIEKYFNPSGMFMTSDESGYHILAFQTRAEENSESDSGSK